MIQIDNLLKTKTRAVVCIDGRSAAGKSTLADKLAKEYDGSIVRMDHFFPPLVLQSNDRINIDIARFEDEVCKGILSGQEFTYRIFDCKKQILEGSITVYKKRLLIVEGAYSMYPLFESLYDFKIFADVSPLEQKRRIMARDGKEKYNLFVNKWIPNEEKYFKKYSVKEKCDYVYNNEKNPNFSAIPKVPQRMIPSLLGEK